MTRRNAYLNGAGRAFEELVEAAILHFACPNPADGLGYAALVLGLKIRIAAWLGFAYCDGEGVAPAVLVVGTVDSIAHGNAWHVHNKLLQI